MIFSFLLFFVAFVAFFFVLSHGEIKMYNMIDSLILIITVTHAHHNSG